MARILVTGGSGYIGGYLVQTLKKHHSVRVFDLKKPNFDGDDLEVYTGDIQDGEQIRSAAEGVDCIIHLAAVPILIPDIEKIYRINVRGTFSVLEAAAACKVKAFILASSICAYGAIFWSKPIIPEYLPVDENHPTQPDDAYGLSKVMAEQLCRAYCSRYGITCLCLRMATVWLPDPSLERTRRFIRSIKEEPMGADRYWAYVDVRDAVQAMELAAAKSLEEEGIFDILNIGANEIIGLFSSMELVKKYYPTVNKLYWRYFMERKNVPLYSIEKAKKELSYQPRITWKEYSEMV
jgi:nucleoside-diphosphate-sugar epimerase